MCSVVLELGGAFYELAHDAPRTLGQALAHAYGIGNRAIVIRRKLYEQAWTEKARSKPVFKAGGVYRGVL